MKHRYRVYFYASDNYCQVLEDLKTLPFEAQVEVAQVFERIREHKGIFDVPIIRHVIGGLKVCNSNCGVDVYYTTIKKRIMMLYLRFQPEPEHVAQQRALKAYRHFVSLEDRYEFP